LQLCLAAFLLAQKGPFPRIAIYTVVQKPNVLPYGLNLVPMSPLADLSDLASHLVIHFVVDHDRQVIAAGIAHLKVDYHELSWIVASLDMVPYFRETLWTLEIRELCGHREMRGMRGIVATEIREEVSQNLLEGLRLRTIFAIVFCAQLNHL
jgi:hypothetical protein